MPELPEVETIVRELAPRLVGRTLRRPRLHKADVLRAVRRRRLLDTLAGATVRSLGRRAKHLVVHLDDGHRLVIQPRMTGALVLYDRRLRREERRYAVLEATLDDGGTLLYRDVRRLGTIHLLDEAAWTTYTARIGPEPLDRNFHVSDFAERIRGTSQAIKKALMDQQRLAGIGNIYANEALHRAGIDPSRRADRLDSRECAVLYRQLRAILEEAIASRGSTVRDYRTGTGGRGSYQLVLRVYGRAGQPCLRCGTPLVTTHAIDRRATTFCWRCQG